MTNQAMQEDLSVLQRLAFVPVIAGLFLYLSYDLFEGVLGIGVDWDNFIALLLTISTWALLFPILKINKWHAKAVVGLMAFMTLFEFFGPNGSIMDEIVTTSVIAVVFYLIFNGIVRVRFELVR